MSKVTPSSARRSPRAPLQSFPTSWNETAGIGRDCRQGVAPGPVQECGAMAEKKKPRRTAERILEVTLELFNRFGEPNVSTTAISAEMNISPGNLYYHYPAKDELINALVDRYERALGELLGAAEQVRDVEDAWLFVHMMFELIW